MPNLHPEKKKGISHCLVVYCPSDPLQFSESWQNHYIGFKPVKLSQPHPPHPLRRGAEAGRPPPSPSPCGPPPWPWQRGEAGGRPQAREIWKVWERNRRLWEQSLLGWGPPGTSQLLSGGLASGLGGCRESGLRAEGFILSKSQNIPFQVVSLTLLGFYPKVELFLVQSQVLSIRKSLETDL